MAKRPPGPRHVDMIATRLISLRLAIGLNQRQFAKRARIGPNTWNNYETGDNRISLDQAFKLTDAYGVSLDWIYQGDAKAMPHDLMLKIHAAEPQAARRVA